jgi:hypothetical protein
LYDRIILSLLKQNETPKQMTTLKVTLPTKKSGQLAVFTIQFSINNFDAVIDAVSECTIENIFNSNLWKVI